MEGLIVFLLAINVVLTIFNFITMFVLGSAFMRNSELLQDIADSLNKRITKGRRYTPEENLMDVTRTQFPQES